MRLLAELRIIGCGCGQVVAIGVVGAELMGFKISRRPARDVLRGCGIYGLATRCEADARRHEAVLSFEPFLGVLS